MSSIIDDFSLLWLKVWLKLCYKTRSSFHIHSCFWIQLTQGFKKMRFPCSPNFFPSYQCPLQLWHAFSIMTNINLRSNSPCFPLLFGCLFVNPAKVTALKSDVKRLLYCNLAIISSWTGYGLKISSLERWTRAFQL